MRALFLFGLGSGCSAHWEEFCNFVDPTACPGYEGGTQVVNPCEQDLGELGYPVLVQEELAYPEDFAIYFTAEPDSRPCGGMVVDASTGREVWVVGLLTQVGTRLDLMVPLEPPEEFQVVSWGHQDNPASDADLADEDGIWWSGTETTADQAAYPNGDHWGRQNITDEEGTQAYLVRDDDAP